ncbi:MAG TPA: beta-propeller fold lactonase family protein [Candidatus Sulfotelmatobacter sp.]|nr:beta-propeller fold lactonase family protein [Candidatus Sulfotelmatobacter sp.]
MSKRWAWLLGAVVLVLIGLLVACGSTYNASSDGLMLVGSQGSGLIETFRVSLNSGHIYAISNTPNDTSNEVCVLNGVPSSLVVDPAGAYAYTIINANSACNNPTPSTTGILAFKINSDGTTTQVGSQVAFTAETVTVLETTNTTSAPVVPGPMVMDPSGKFLFVADRATTDSNGLYVPGAVSVFAIGSGGSLTEVAGSPFFTSSSPTTLSQSGQDIFAVAPTPTVFPARGLNGVQNAACSDVFNNPPTLEYLYAVDQLGNQVFEFAVNTTSGVLTNPSTGISEPSFPTDPTPAGVAVDPCNRFVYVSDSLTNKVSAYSMCNGSVTSQVNACKDLSPGALVPVAGSPFLLSGSANSPGPLVVDPYGRTLYVLGTLSNTINPLSIGQISGALAALSPPTVATGIGPVSIAIRADDSWLFVANYGAGNSGGNTVSQYSVTPQSGALSAEPVIQTDNYPWGVAVK